MRKNNIGQSQPPPLRSTTVLLDSVYYPEEGHVMPNVDFIIHKKLFKSVQKCNILHEVYVISCMKCNAVASYSTCSS